MTQSRKDAKQIIDSFDGMVEARLYREIVLRFFPENGDIDACNEFVARADAAFIGQLGPKYAGTDMPGVFFPTTIDVPQRFSIGKSSNWFRQSTYTYTHDMDSIFEQLASDFSNLPNLEDKTRNYPITVTLDRSLALDNFLLIQLLGHENTKAFSLFLMIISLIPGPTSAMGIGLIIVSVALLLISCLMPKVARITVESEHYEISERVYESPNMQFI